MSRRLPWLLLVAVLSTALVVGSRGHRGPPTLEQRVHRIASDIRCPTCRSISAADSDAEASKAIRAEIARRVRAGQSDREVRGFLVGKYGADILLRPEGRGVAALVWALPAAGLVIALGALAVAFRRWRTSLPAEASPEDRALVDEALSGP